jgi:hypothetical protein
MRNLPHIAHEHLLPFSPPPLFPCLDAHPSIPLDLLECSKDSASRKSRKASRRKSSRYAHPITSNMVFPHPDFLGSSTSTFFTTGLGSAVDKCCEQESGREDVEDDGGGFLVCSDGVKH